jgi:predicted transcriptional regulator of viral defense system
MKVATRLREYVKKAGFVEFKVLDSLGLTSSNSLRVTLNRLVKAGEFYNPARGIYVSKDADPFMIATVLKPGYLSLGTALYLHHLIEEYPFTVFVACGGRGSFRLGEHELRYFKAKSYLGAIEKPYKMASVEKAIFDCLLHADLVGYAKIAKALHGSEISAKAFLALSRGEDSAFFQRLGYILSLLPKLDKEKQKLLGHCRKKVRANAYLQGRRKGKHVPDWKLIDNVGEKVILSWWQQ